MMIGVVAFMLAVSSGELSPPPWTKYPGSMVSAFDRATVRSLADTEAGAAGRALVATSTTKAIWTARTGDLVKLWDEGSQFPKIWIFVDYRNDATAKEREGRMRFGIRCAEQSYAILSDITYAPDGSVLSSRSGPDMLYAYQAIAPETMMEAVMQAACP